MIYVLKTYHGWEHIVAQQLEHPTLKKIHLPSDPFGGNSTPGYIYPELTSPLDGCFFRQAMDHPGTLYFLCPSSGIQDAPELPLPYPLLEAGAETEIISGRYGGALCCIEEVNFPRPLVSIDIFGERALFRVHVKHLKAYQNLRPLKKFLTQEAQNDKL